MTTIQHHKQQWTDSYSPHSTTATTTNTSINNKKRRITHCNAGISYKRHIQLQMNYISNMNDVVASPQPNTTSTHHHNLLLRTLYTPDILYHIYGYLKFNAVLQLALVCKQWYGYICNHTDSYITQQQHLQLTNLPHSKTVLSSMVQLKSITIDLSNRTIRSDTKLQLIQSIGSHPSQPPDNQYNTSQPNNLHTIRIYNIGTLQAKHTDTLLHKNIWNTIQSLTITQCTDDITSWLHYDLCQHELYSSLTYLNLSKCTVSSTLFSHIYNLHSIVLNQCNGVSSDVLNSITTNCNSTLQCIELSGCTHYSTTSLQQLIQYCTVLHTMNLTDCGIVITDDITNTFRLYCIERMKHLRVAGCYKLSEYGFENISQCTRLELFDASYCPKFDDHVCSVLIENCVQLTSLILTNCYKITNSLIQLLCTTHKLPRLRVLDLYATSITDHGIQYINQLNTVEILNLGNCNTITDTGIAQLATMVQLKSLQLDNCIKLHGRYIDTLSTLVNLEQISLFGCSMYEEKHLINVISSWNKLNFINIRACSRMTYTVVQYIQSILPYCTVDHCITQPPAITTNDNINQQQLQFNDSSNDKPILLRLTGLKSLGNTVKNTNRTLFGPGNVVKPNQYTSRSITNSRTNSIDSINSSNKYIIDLTDEFDHVEREMRSHSNSENSDDDHLHNHME